MALQQRKRTTKKKTPAKKGHRVAGTKKKDTKKGLLDAIGKKSDTKKKAKEEKPTINLEGQAAALLELQQAKARYKEAEGRVKELEGELIPEMEGERRALCMARKKYIRSINVRANGEDEDGEEVDAGTALYYIQNKYSPFNPRAASTDEDVIEAVGDGATLRDEAIYHIALALREHNEDEEETEEETEDAPPTEEEWEEAETLYNDRFQEKNHVTLKDGALDDDDVIEVLREHLLEWLESVTKATPTGDFHERSHFDPLDRIIMDAVQNIGLARRAKGTVKPAGAPKALRKAVKRK